MHEIEPPETVTRDDGHHDADRRGDIPQIIPADEAGRGQFGLACERLITFAHFSISSARTLLNSAGEPVTGAPPVSAMRAFIWGSAKAALTALFRVSMTSVEVLLGAPRPVTALAS